MNSRHSSLVTGRLAIAWPDRKTRWRGRSQSKAKPSPSTDLDDALAAAMRSSAARRAKQAGRRQLAISRLERVLGERREDVGQEQLLMLLLVIDAELDRARARQAEASASARSSASST